MHGKGAGGNRQPADGQYHGIIVDVHFNAEMFTRLIDRLHYRSGVFYFADVFFKSVQRIGVDRRRFAVQVAGYLQVYNRIPFHGCRISYYPCGCDLLFGQSRRVVHVRILNEGISLHKGLRL